MTLNANQTVREIAIENPAAIGVFESLGIDFCCGGSHSLDAACATANVPVENVLQALTAAARTAAPRAETGRWQEAKLAALTAYIVEKHHGFVKRETPRLQALLAKVQERHAAGHPELVPIGESFNAMADELRSHMLKEEQVLFPYINRLEAAMRDGRPMPRPPFGSVANPVRMMMAEHDNAGALLKRMRSASRNYAAPDTDCPTYAALYRGLEDFERDLHLHVHLENNILFPRAVELERQIAGGAG